MSILHSLYELERAISSRLAWLDTWALASLGLIQFIISTWVYAQFTAYSVENTNENKVQCRKYNPYTVYDGHTF